MSNLKGYDAWLEKPFQDECAAAERAEAMEEDAENEADAAMCDPVRVATVLDDFYDHNDSAHVEPLAQALSLLQRAAIAPADEVAELEDQAVAQLHVLRKILHGHYLRSTLMTMEVKAAVKDRRAADDLAADLAGERRAAREIGDW